MSRPTLVVAVHDGFYGVGTGAGYANRAFLEVLADHLLPGVHLVVMPVHLNPSSPEYDPLWHARTRAILQKVHASIRPVDNGTAGRQRFGGPEAFGCLARDTASALLGQILPGADPVLVIAFDVPFLGLGALLPPQVGARVIAVPRSTALLHDPSNTRRIDDERRALAALTGAGGQVAAISAHMREHLRNAYAVPSPALIDFPDGLTDREQTFTVPGPRFLPAPARAGFLLTIGRAHPYKGFDDLIDALLILRQDHVPLPHTVIAAVTEDSTLSAHQLHLSRRLAELGPDATTLLTRFTPKIRGLLAHPALRAVIVPSRTEPFGRIPIEAYAAGAAPVVATTAGGLREQVIHDITGITTEPSDPLQLACAIRRAVELTEPDRDRLRRAGRAILRERYNATTTTHRFLTDVAPWSLTPTTAHRPSKRCSSGEVEVRSSRHLNR